MTRIRGLLEGYAEAHSGALPESLGDLWSAEKKAELAEVFWPEWAFSLIGQRPPDWPQTPQDLDVGGGYVRVYNFHLDGKPIIVTERETLKARAPQYTLAVAEDLSKVWVYPEN